MKKKLVAVLMSSALALSLAACGGGEAASTESNKEQQTQPADQQAEKQTEEKADGEQVEITITHFNIEEQREQTADYDGFYTMLEAWQEEHPDVKITQSVLSTADYETKIQAQAAVGDMPDLFCVKGSWFKNFVSSDLLTPMSGAIDAYEHKDAFREGVFDAATVGGEIYGIPIQFSVSSLVYYNAAMWEEIGYSEFPATWEEIYDAVDKFNEKGITPFSLGNLDKWPAESCILSALGDRYTGNEWTNNIIANNGQSAFTDPEFVSALEHLQNMAQAGVFNADFNTSGTGPAAELYNQGQAAATINGFWNLANINANATDEVKANTKIAILPPVEGGKGEAGSTSGGCGWYMGMAPQEDPEKAALVENLLMHLGGYEYSVFLTEKYGLVAPSVVEGVDVSAFPPATQEYIKLMQTVQLTPIYDILMDASVIEVMNSDVQELMNGSKDAQTVAEEIQAELENVGK